MKKKSWLRLKCTIADGAFDFQIIMNIKWIGILSSIITVASALLYLSSHLH